MSEEVKIEKNYEKALDEIKDEYDAFYIANKYESDVTKTTHGTQFAKLLELKGDKVTNAVHWIAREYDCYYKNEYENEDDTAFGYLRELCKKKDIEMHIDDILVRNGREDLI